MGHGKGAYATKEAAEQAKAEFKAWVNTEMNKPKRVAAAASTAARATAPTYPPLPTRFSRRTGTTVHVDRVVLTLRVGDGAHVSAKLDAQPDVAALEESWRARSVNWRAVARKRRAENLEEHAAATRARMSESRYKLFLEHCRDMHAGAVKWAGSVAPRSPPLAAALSPTRLLVAEWKYGEKHSAGWQHGATLRAMLMLRRWSAHACALRRRQATEEEAAIRYVRYVQDLLWHAVR